MGGPGDCRARHRAESRVHVARRRRRAVRLPTADALGCTLAGIHGPTHDLAQTMRRLGPFPAMGSLVDAQILDVHLVAQRGGPVDGDHLEVVTRYSRAVLCQSTTPDPPRSA